MDADHRSDRWLAGTQSTFRYRRFMHALRLICTSLALALAVGCADTAAKSPNSSQNTDPNNVADMGTNSAPNNQNISDNVVPNGDHGGEVCPGFEAPTGDNGTCREDGDCDGGGYCAPARNTACGIPCGAPQECFDDNDCDDGLVCQVYDASSEPCCYPGDQSRECVSVCEPGACPDDHTCEADGHCRPTSCENGFTCADGLVCAPQRDADEHGCAPPDCTVDDFECPPDTECNAGSTVPTKCEPIHCNDGYECPVNHRCEPSATGHGCIKKSCDVDTDCDCGACVNATCEPFIWICALPAA